MNKILESDNFFERYFRLLTLTFWPIMWYKWNVISSRKLEYILFLTYSAFTGIYFILFTIRFFKADEEKKESMMFYYRASTVVAFVVSLFSFVLFPKNIPLFYFKLFSISVYLYFSYREVFKKKNDEGVVGIMSFLLLLALTIFY